MRRTKENAEQTKDNILNAAVKLFSEKGVTNTSLQDVAKAANVTRGAIYWHFKNKIEIFDALHERLHRPLVDMIMEDVRKDHPEPLEQLQDLCVKLLLDIEENPQKKQALVLFMLRCDYSGELAAYKEKHNKKKREKQKAFTRYFEKAKKKGKLPPSANPDLLTLSVHCYMKGILFEYLNDPAAFQMGTKAPKLIKLFFSNLSAS